MRGSGYGSLLLRRFLDAGRTRGLQRAVLEVHPGSTAALRMYEAAGFTVANECVVKDPATGRELCYRHMTVRLA